MGRANDTAVPTKLGDCTSGGGEGAGLGSVSLNAIERDSFDIDLNKNTNPFVSTSYFCYTWEATGIVSPRTFSVWATVDGSTTLDHSTLETVNIGDAAYTNSNNIDDTDIWLTSSGDLYKVVNDGLDDSANGIYYYYKAFMDGTQTSFTATADGSIDEGSPGGIPNTTTINDLYVREDDDGSMSIQNNTLYIGTAEGLYIFEEDRQGYDVEFTATTRGDLTGNMKLYTKDFASELMPEDSRAVWGWNNNTASDKEDLSGNGNTLINNNSVPITSSGVRGNAPEFNGTDHFYSMYDDDSISFDNNTMSASFWMKKDGNPSSQEFMLLKGVGSWEYGARVYTTGEVYISFWTSGGTNVAYVESESIVTDNQWHHIVFTSNGSELNIYIDGVLDGTTTSFSGSMSNTTANLYIGDRNDLANAEYEGYLDEMMLTGKYLEADEIRRIYNDGRRALDGSHNIDDTYNSLNGTSNDVRSLLVTPDGRYLYAGTDGGGISKMDLMSDTQLDTYTTSTTPATATNNIETIAGRYHPRFAGDIGSSGRIIGLSGDGESDDGEYVSETVTFDTRSNKAYLWMHAYMDPDDSSAEIVVSASNDGGSNYVLGNLIKTNTSGDLPEYEYSFDFASSDDDYKVKINMLVLRGSGLNSSTYVKDWALAQMDINGGTGNGLYSQEDVAVASGSYLDVVHGQGTYDLIAKGWVYNTDLSKWVEVENTDSTVIHSKSEQWSDGSTIRSTVNTSDVQLTDTAGYYYGVYTSDEIPTLDAQGYGNIFWNEDLDTNGNITVQTRTGSTTDSTDGSWEAWKPSTNDYKLLKFSR